MYGNAHPLSITHHVLKYQEVGTYVYKKAHTVTSVLLRSHAGSATMILSSNGTAMVPIGESVMQCCRAWRKMQTNTRPLQHMLSCPRRCTSGILPQPPWWVTVCRMSSSRSVLYCITWQQTNWFCSSVLDYKMECSMMIMSVYNCCTVSCDEPQGQQ